MSTNSNPSKLVFSSLILLCCIATTCVIADEIDLTDRMLLDGLDIPKPKVVDIGKPATIGGGSSNPFGSRTILIGVSCGAKEFARRELVRQRQIAKYPGYDITWRFFMGKPLAIYQEAIKAENATYGDLVICEEVVDTREIARQKKPFYFFKWVEANLGKFDWVSKMDTDTFMNIPLFWKQFFTPEIRARSNTVIALNWLVPSYRCMFPEGGFYTFTWDLLVMLNHLFDTIPAQYPPEDIQWGQYFCDAGHRVDQIDMPASQAFHFRTNIDDKRNICHTIFDDSVRVHDLKTEEEYLMVTDCFDTNGYNEERTRFWKEHSWNFNLTGYE